MPKANPQASSQQQPDYQYDNNTGMDFGLPGSLNRRLLMAFHLGQYRTVSGNPADMNDGIPMLDVRTKHQEEEVPMKDEDLILASPILYGFSLSDKIWCMSFHTSQVFRV